LTFFTNSLKVIAKLKQAHCIWSGQLVINKAVLTNRYKWGCGCNHHPQGGACSDRTRIENCSITRCVSTACV